MIPSRGLRVWFLLVSLFVGAMAGAQDFTIQNLDVVMNVEDDATLSVQETINVVFDTRKRGIIREIPYDFEVPGGSRRRTKITDIEVSADYSSSPGMLVKRKGRNITIRIGEPDVLLNPDQTYVYQIRYKIRNAINWRGENEEWEPWAEIYWNATGHEWTASIMRSSVTVNFPETADTNVLRASVYPGRFGSREVVSLVGGGNITEGPTHIELGSSTLRVDYSEQFRPGEGLTFMLGVPTSSIPLPPLGRRIGNWVGDHTGYLLPAFVLFGLFIVWVFVGRDPKAGPIEPSFEIPNELGPAECGYLLDNRIDTRDIAAILISLMNKGHLQLEVASNTGEVDILSSAFVSTNKRNKNGLSGAESIVLGALENGSSTVDQVAGYLRPKMHAVVAALESDLKINGYYRTSPSQSQGFAVWTAIGVAGVTFLVGLVLAFNFFDWASYLIGGALCVPVVLFFRHLMPQRTVEGAYLHRRIAGLHKALRDRNGFLEWHGSTGGNQEIFEKLLPYMVAFGILRPWSKRAGALFKRPPSWLRSNMTDDSQFDPHGFFKSFMLAMEFIESEIVITVREPAQRTTSFWDYVVFDSDRDDDSWWSGGGGGSSGGGWSGGGFGGGGFSGGGFGGGGGSSW